MTKSAKLRAALTASPGATLGELHDATKIERDFISTVCSKWVRKGQAKGSSAEGYTLSETLPPKMLGNKAALRAVRGGVKRQASANAVQVGGEHYRNLGIQPWDAMAAWVSPEAFAGFLQCNIIKYVARWQHKGGIEDLRKLRHYADKLIEFLGRGGAR